MTFENIDVYNIENAIRGMRNPLMSHEKSDTDGVNRERTSQNRAEATLNAPTTPPGCPTIGEHDYDLATRLIAAGEPHRKFLRQIFVSVDLCKVPSYMLHELATYKVGTTLDSSSTMHCITSRPLTADDFEEPETYCERIALGDCIAALNAFRDSYVGHKNENDTECAEKDFRALKRLLPSGYLYERMTWTANYEVLRNIYKWRRNHRLPVWHQFCDDFIAVLPYSKFITR